MWLWLRLYGDERNMRYLGIAPDLFQVHSPWFLCRDWHRKGHKQVDYSLWYYYPARMEPKQQLKHSNGYGTLLHAYGPLREFEHSLWHGGILHVRVREAVCRPVLCVEPTQHGDLVGKACIVCGCNNVSNKKKMSRV